MKYIITTAYSNSEWDHAEVAIIRLDDRMKENVKKWRAKIPEIIEMGGDQIVVSADEVEFFAITEAFEKKYGNADEFPAQIIRPPKNMSKYFTATEQVIRYGSVKYGENEITFTGYGKHTNEEYWCYVPYSFFE